MLQLLAGIMHLGNVEFEADEHDNAQIKASCKSTSLKHSMKLLQCPVLDVKLMTRIVKAKGRNSIYTVPLNLTEAQEARDALAKAVYDNLFFYLISLCNSNLHSHSKIEVRQSRERSDESRQQWPCVQWPLCRNRSQANQGGAIDGENRPGQHQRSTRSEPDSVRWRVG